MSAVDPGELVFDARWAAVTKLDVDAATVATWDRGLPRDSRLLVPIDVQALFVPVGGDESMVRLPSALNAADGRGLGFPASFTAGTRRPAGVHLQWAPPDALMRGQLDVTPDRNRLGLPALPDRWIVLRLLTPLGARTAVVHGWVLEADRAARIELADWPAGSAAATPAGATVAAAELTGAAGGVPTWAVTYDSVENRFALYDPLDELAQVAPNGVAGEAATYVVAGWWSDTSLDPLDAANDADSLDELLHSLGWSAVTPWVDTPAYQRTRDDVAQRRVAVNLTSANRFVLDPNDQPPPAPPIVEQPVTEMTSQIRSTLADKATAAFFTTPWWPHATLLHGSVYGVPLRALGPALDVDNRPSADVVRVSLGSHDDDVIGALAVAGFDTPTDEARRDTERLLGAFTGQLLRELGRPNGAVAVEEHEHDIAFGSLPGGTRGDDRFLAGQSGVPLKIGRGGRTAATKQTADTTAGGIAAAQATVQLSKLFLERRAMIAAADVDAIVSAASGRADPPIDAEPRLVPRPAPRFQFPLDPMVAIQGASRSLRHGGDGRGSPDGLLWCRWAHQTVRELKGLVSGAAVLPTLGNGAVPEEVLYLAQEALLHSPYNRGWLSDVAASSTGLGRTRIGVRLDAEAAIRFGANAVYDGTTQALASEGAGRIEKADLADQLMRHSMFVGAEPSPIGITAWSQPWVPMWLEWEAELRLTDTLRGWQLDSVDLEPDPDVSAVPTTTTILGRSLLTTGGARTMAAAVRDFLAAEDALETATGGVGDVPQDVETALAALAGAVENLDLVTTTLDGIRLALLGLDASDGFQRTRAEDGTFVPPAPVASPQLLASGAIRVTKARLLDTFGRTLDLPTVATAAVPIRNEVAGQPGQLRLRPRLPRAARWMFRLVDAGGGQEPAEARIDQVDPAGTVNPVAGFLLPDHLDESLEVFDAAGSSVGEMFHEPIGGRVVWEIAPGRPGPPDAGPQFGLSGGQLPLGWFATGLVGADVKDRNSPTPSTESALSAALRAIDTTLWTVDTFAGLGSEHIAGLVGRPIAVVRAQLWLELQPEDLVDLSDPSHAEERRAAETALAAEAFPVRLGELTRTDDGLLGFFVDDDFEHLHLVDRVVAALAKPAGPGGHLSDQPAPIEHQYLVAEDTVTIHFGQRLTLTLLMHPAGRVHLTSGVLPRKAIDLAREWVAPGLARLSPSLRTGPLLIEPDQVRLPKVSVFGARQVFTRRDTPATWRDDPILAATQTALLPDGPTSVQDGYIRVMPATDDQT
jgi:hypothetical protein